MKLVLMKDYIGMDRNCNGVLYFKQKYPGVSETEIKERTFVGQSIREIVRISMSVEILTEAKRDLEGVTKISSKTRKHKIMSHVLKNLSKPTKSGDV
jgi:hypothetical protein